MPLFPQPFIDEVRAVADIVTVISDHVSLRRAGASYKGLCPFHTDKTPSFTVNRDKGFFHCFGCGVGGDVFKFVELQEKVGFADAVRHLAQRFGISVPELEASEQGRESAAERESLLKAHEIAAVFFQEQLNRPEAGRIREYLERQRGLKLEVIAQLGLGLAPQGRDTLRRRLMDHGFQPAVLLKSGLVVRRDDGSEVDRFRNRLMIPISRDAGSIVAFGGRALEKDQVPKYLNSPETPIYTKSRTLYGLNLTKAALRQSHFAVIVEGYFDFAQVFQAGGLPVVASCGTALTADQARLLRRFAPKAIICFDPDAAGQGAAERSSELLVAAGFDVNVALLPTGEDPDTFLQKRGRDAFVGQLTQSRPYLEFLMDRTAASHDLSRDDNRREFLRQMLAVASRIPDPAARDQFADRLAHKARVTEGVVRSEIRKAAAERKTELPTERLPSLATRTLKAEKGLIWALIHEPARAMTSISSLQPEDFQGLSTESVLKAALELKDRSPEDVPSVLLERLNEWESRMVAAIAAEAESPVLDAQACVSSLRFARIERELSAIQDELAQPNGLESNRLDVLLRKKNALRSQLESARHTPPPGGGAPARSAGK
jgi:DNA primase